METAELRNQILLALPPQDILRCRRVCTAWREAIDHVPEPVRGVQARQPTSWFRRALFLEADERELPPRTITQSAIERTKKIGAFDYSEVEPGSTKAHRSEYLRSKMGIDLENPEDMPWLTEFMLIWGTEMVDVYVKSFIEHITPRRVTINPALFRLEGRPTVMKRRDPSNIEDPERADGLFRSRRAHFLVDPLAELPEEDSRLDMFITQPPVKKVALRWELYRHTHPTHRAEAGLEQREGNSWNDGIPGSEESIEREAGIRYRDVTNLMHLVIDRIWVRGEPEDAEISPHRTDLFRTYIVTDPETDLSHSHSWGSRLPRDGRDSEPEWLHAWNLFRKNDRNWNMYLAYHRVIKLGHDPDGDDGDDPETNRILMDITKRQGRGPKEFGRLMNEYTNRALHRAMEGAEADKRQQRNGEAYHENWSDDEEDQEDLWKRRY
ncbi:hypothetical protein BST61_g10298 [Cercospora zeina]